MFLRIYFIIFLVKENGVFKQITEIHIYAGFKKMIGTEISRRCSIYTFEIIK